MNTAPGEGEKQKQNRHDSSRLWQRAILIDPRLQSVTQHDDDNNTPKTPVTAWESDLLWSMMLRDCGASGNCWFLCVAAAVSALSTNEPVSFQNVRQWWASRLSRDFVTDAAILAELDLYYCAAVRAGDRDAGACAIANAYRQHMFPTAQDASIENLGRVGGVGGGGGTGAPQLELHEELQKIATNKEIVVWRGDEFVMRHFPAAPQLPIQLRGNRLVFLVVSVISQPSSMPHLDLRVYGLSNRDDDDHVSAGAGTNQLFIILYHHEGVHWQLIGHPRSLASPPSAGGWSDAEIQPIFTWSTLPAPYRHVIEQRAALERAARLAQNRRRQAMLEHKKSMVEPAGVALESKDSLPLATASAVTTATVTVTATSSSPDSQRAVAAVVESKTVDHNANASFTSVSPLLPFPLPTVPVPSLSCRRAFLRTQSRLR